MRGIAFAGDRQVSLISVDDPMPGPTDVILEVKASGMCGSDLHDYRADASSPDVNGSLIRGHEPAGVVVAAGDAVAARFAATGARVMVHHYHGCGTCRQCRTGWSQLCTDGPATVYGTNAHGSHAPYMKVPAATLVPLDERLSFAAGAAISCGAGTAWGALARLGATGRETLAVFGQGPVGLSATMLAAAQGVRVIALDLSDKRLALAEGSGADVVINVSVEDSVARIREITDGRGVELALETSGSSIAGRAVLESVSVWGRACFVGLGATVEVGINEFLDRQISVMTSWAMSIAGQMELAQFAISRNLDVDRLFTDRWRFGQAAEAYASFDRQTSGKGVFVF